MEYQVTTGQVRDLLRPRGQPIPVPREAQEVAERASALALLGIMERLERIAELMSRADEK